MTPSKPISELPGLKQRKLIDRRVARREGRDLSQIGLADLAKEWVMYYWQRNMGFGQKLERP